MGNKTQAQRAGELADDIINSLATPATEDDDSDSSVAGSDQVTHAGSDTAAQLQEMQRRLDEADQRWRSAQGMIAQKDNDIVALRELLASMNQTSAQAQPTEPVQKQLVTQRDEEQFGPDLVDMVRRAVREVADQKDQEIGALVNEVNRLRQQVGSVEATTVQDRKAMMESALSQAIPEWKKLDSDPRFLAWLSETDEGTGYPRINLLRHASQNFDTKRVLYWFNRYLAESGQAPAEPAGAQREPTKPREGRLADALVAPQRSRSTSRTDTGDQTEKKVWTRREITEFYRQAGIGLVKGDERDRIERDIIAATRDGRIADA